MLPAFKKGPGRLEAAERVKEWTRERFGLARGAAILVAEVECALPGCPPLETVISFWDGDGARYHFKIFKRVAQVTNDDLPFAWMKDALAVPEGFECDCC
jgi:hypothetical protein